MAKSSDRAECAGVTKKGKACSCRALPGSHFCGHHQPRPKSSTPDPPPTDNGFRFEFMDIAQEVLRELQTLDVPVTARPQYYNIVVTCVTRAKEEQRLLDGIGAGVTHAFVLRTPQGDRPLPPPDESVSDAEGNGKGQTVH